MCVRFKLSQLLKNKMKIIFRASKLYLKNVFYNCDLGNVFKIRIYPILRNPFKNIVNSKLIEHLENFFSTKSQKQNVILMLFFLSNGLVSEKKR